MALLKLNLEHLATPIGTLLVVNDLDGYLRAVDWQDHHDRMLVLMRRQYRGHAVELKETTARSAAANALQAYFDGELDAICHLKARTGGTDFQRQVWAALCGIACGEVISYGELASRIGRPKAVRAIGLANGANPISIVVPCHRVIGANGTLTGYGGGLERKKWLLDHENAL